MQKWKKVIIYSSVTLLTLAVVCLGSLYLILFYRVQRLEIINNTGNTLSQVDFVLENQKYVIKDIKNKEKKKINFEITRDSGAKLLIYDKDNNLKKEKLLSGYLTSGYNAYFIVTIYEDFSTVVFYKEYGL